MEGRESRNSGRGGEGVRTLTLNTTPWAWGQEEVDAKNGGP